MKQSIAEVVHRAQWVEHFEERGVLVVWHGGLTVNVHSAETGECFDCWTMGGRVDDSKPTLREVQESIEGRFKAEPEDNTDG
jgi:hypothetical protein